MARYEPTKRSDGLQLCDHCRATIPYDHYMWKDHETGDIVCSACAGRKNKHEGGQVMPNEIDYHFPCIKTNSLGESNCKDAKFNLACCGMECTHKCVVTLQKELREARRRAERAESVLEKYREAVRPVVKNCRVIVEFADKANGEEVRDGE